MILDTIVAYKKKAISQEKEKTPYDRLVQKLITTNYPKATGIKEKLKQGNQLAIIAEVKKASPSKGVIREDFNPVEIALEYELNQVAAISVLTEEVFFQGKDQYLMDIKGEVRTPILRKDFIIDPYQICQSKVLGADIILLITAILSNSQLKEYIAIAHGIGLECLVEVHDEEELKRALALGADLIGINNRNLKTFITDLKTTERLMAQMPKDKVVISESGISTRQDMEYLQSLGVDGVLIGESLMQATSITNKLKELQVG